jgi:hypothetical protein
MHDTWQVSLQLGKQLADGHLVSRVSKNLVFGCEEMVEKSFHVTFALQSVGPDAQMGMRFGIEVFYKVFRNQITLHQYVRDHKYTADTVKLKEHDS